MEINNLVKLTLITLTLASSLPTVSHAMSEMEINSEGDDLYYDESTNNGYSIDDSINNDFYSDDRHNTINNHNYSNYSYDYNSFGHYKSMRRSDDNSDYFSAGISSYQGTSTGPGPNGGYPGSPRGTYQTNYFNTTDNSAYYNNTPLRRQY